MQSLDIIVPSRGRPENIDRLVSAMDATIDHDMTRLLVVVDQDDPKLRDYQTYMYADSPHWAKLEVQGRWARIGPILNGITATRSHGCSHIGFLGDDHVPRTFHWDQYLVESLGGRPGVAYGDDMFQHANLPTACIISSDLIRALGYFCPPGLNHLYLDNFWSTLGYAVGNLQYVPQVIIEHMHPLAGKAEVDAGYQYSLAADTLTEDGRRYGDFLSQRWPGDLMRMRVRLAGMGVA
jgi:hypothetical protein